MRLESRHTIKRFIVFMSLSLFMQNTYADTRSLEQELAGRHFELVASDLAGIFGGEDKVVSDLIKLRDIDTPPFVSTRAEKLLLGFSNREDVMAVLRQDVVGENSLGLCSIILANITEIPEQAFRVELAQLALSSINTKSGNKVLPSRINRIKSILNSSTDKKVKALVGK